MFKIKSKLRKRKKKKKIEKKVFVSEVIAFEDVAINFSRLRREYLASAVNGLTNSAKVLHITKTDFFQLNCLHNDQ